MANHEYVVIADVYSEKECSGLYTFNSPIFDNLEDAENFFNNWDIPVDEMLQKIKEHLKDNKDETNIQISIGIRRND